MENIEIDECGDCLGCIQQKALQSLLATIDANYPRLVEQLLARPFLDEAEAMATRKKWEMDRARAVTTMKLTGCRSPSYVLSNA